MLSNDFMSQIDHVVYLMLENRSFDNVVGWLYADQNNIPGINIPPPPPHQKPSFNGLGKCKQSNLPPHDLKFLHDHGPQYVQFGASNCHIPKTDPYEPYQHVYWQLYGTGTDPYNQEPPKPAPMSGFLADYSSHLDVISREHALEIMQAYTHDQLSVLNGLAKNYAVSDEWFSSVPSQTFCNRGFAGAGTSDGMVDNHYFFDRFKGKTIWDTLHEKQAGLWKIYYQDGYLTSVCQTQHLFENLDNPAYKPYFQHMGDYSKKAGSGTFFGDAQAGALPAFSFLEPLWYHGMNDMTRNGNSYHPPAELAPAETFVKQVYDSLTSHQAAWEKTLLIITFDEHGGTYDHVSPPRAAEPNLKENNPNKYGFKFNRYGVRVPALLVSPYISPQTVFRSGQSTPYDHTSTIATILSWQGIDPKTCNMGDRVATAPTFEGVLESTVVQATPPEVAVADWCQSNDADVEPEDQPLNDLQKDLLPLLVYNISDLQLATDDEDNGKMVQDIIAKCKTHRDLSNYVAVYRQNLKT
jgi:phospholipase C